MTKHYDRAYFDRWYRDGGIGGPARLARKVALAVATAEYHLERPIRSVLDIGCHGRSRNLRLARFGDFATLRPCAPADLLVCSDVLHYLPTRELDRGLPALADLCGGVAFIEVFAREDETEGDDHDFQPRPAAFYRRRLRAVGLQPLGSHCWLSPARVPLATALELPG